MSKSTPVKNGLIPAVVQVKGAGLVECAYDFMKLVEWCFVPFVLPYDTDVGLYLC